MCRRRGAGWTNLQILLQRIFHLKSRTGAFLCYTLLLLRALLVVVVNEFDPNFALPPESGAIKRGWPNLMPFNDNRKPFLQSRNPEPEEWRAIVFRDFSRNHFCAPPLPRIRLLCPLNVNSLTFMKVLFQTKMLTTKLHIFLCHAKTGEGDTPH